MTVLEPKIVTVIQHRRINGAPILPPCVGRLPKSTVVAIRAGWLAPKRTVHAVTIVGHRIHQLNVKELSLTKRVIVVILELPQEPNPIALTAFLISYILIPQRFALGRNMSHVIIAVTTKNCSEPKIAAKLFLATQPYRIPGLLIRHRSAEISRKLTAAET